MGLEYRMCSDCDSDDRSDENKPYTPSRSDYMDIQIGKRDYTWTKKEE